ncbi:hypothetical protein HNP12_003845 [Aeromonas hydrophila]|uniref:hypothetical protein n=2 Tax=Aeromonas hydrophila TaxID=644 RepID=UPI0021670C65|nr:hypothetical protein [Aeromonas hydrophila]MCS3769723.1 hypothetical protein [Aeromonas hydrophila]MCS3793716.1 hypothetical protein [Aeromonas hydrophila]
MTKDLHMRVSSFFNSSFLVIVFFSFMPFPVIARVTFNDFLIDKRDVYHGASHALTEEDTGFYEIDWARKNAIKEKPNFAGHYVVYTFSCGTGALCGEVLDLKTGLVISRLPHPYESESLKLDTIVNSYLMIVSGVEMDTEEMDGSTLTTKCYILDRTGFDLKFLDKCS